jgi:hypothetical protein
MPARAIAVLLFLSLFKKLSIFSSTPLQPWGFDRSVSFIILRIISGFLVLRHLV